MHAFGQIAHLNCLRGLICWRLVRNDEPMHFGVALVVRRGHNRIRRLDIEEELHEAVPSEKALLKLFPKLGAHRTVKKKVYRAVDEHKHVKQLGQIVVDLVKVVGRNDRDKKSDAMRKLHDKEQEHNDQQHCGRSIKVGVACGLDPVIFYFLLVIGGDLHHVYEHYAEHKHDEAWQGAEHDCVDPKVDCGQIRILLGQAA